MHVTFIVNAKLKGQTGVKKVVLQNVLTALMRSSMSGTVSFSFFFFFNPDVTLSRLFNNDINGNHKN